MYPLQMVIFHSFLYVMLVYQRVHHIAQISIHPNHLSESIHCFGKSSVVGHDTEVVLSWSQTPRPARFMAFKCPRGARAVGLFIDL